MNNILVLGSGAREHAIIDTLLYSQTIKTIFVYPGNDGIFNQSNKIAKTTIINYENSLVEFCNTNKIHFVISGAETLLVDGIYDYLQNHNINCFGPNKEGALIEGSKAFSKHFMVENNIPTANYNTFTSFDTFRQFYEKSIKNKNDKYVIKASGLACGKGVIIPETNEELYKEVEDMLVNKKFKDASNEIIIEERLEGEEVSIMGFCNGSEISLMPQSQDYKKIYDNNKGLNTGGMGSHAPVFILNESELNEIEEHMNKVVKKLNYKGILYGGIMKTVDGLYFLEFNCRLGDPEAQVLLNLIDTSKTDLYTIITDCMKGNKINVEWKRGYASNLVLSHEDYPIRKSDKDLKIIIDKEKLKHNNIKIYWSNVSIDDNNNYYTRGGRVLSMINYNSYSFEETFTTIYNNVKWITYEKQYYRRDIGLNKQYILCSNKIQNKIQNISTIKNNRSIKIGILGSTKGNSIDLLIDKISNKEINASIELIITNRKIAPILEKAKINNINYIYLSPKNQNREQYDRQIVNLMRIFDVELIILVGYMKIVSPILINEYKGNIINIHPSLLPKYGNMMDLDVHQTVINNKERFTGCTIHHVVEEVDGGDIIQQKQLLIETDNPLKLKLQIQKLESESLIEVISIYLKKSLTYKDSGVNIEEGNNLVSNIKEISDEIGGFAALYELPQIQQNNQQSIVLGAATDGVGTKLEVAIKMNKFDTIGIDLVAMSVNDLFACGIRPLFFLDYVAIDKMDAVKCKKIIDGINKGCNLANCQLIGGETAEMKGIYMKDKFDMGGFAVGIQEYKLDPLNNIKSGNYIYALSSSGIHSNGYTLVNKLLKFSDYNLEEIIAPTRIYMETLYLLEKYKVELVGISHITGGGFVDNITRILPRGLSFKLKEWDFPPIFKWIQKQSNISREEMLNTFNCGYGMVFIFNTSIIEEEGLDLIGKII
jgi:formyltetrahydrofolate-dependent phosphoribosylglycinamide formyltransferase